MADTPTEPNKHLSDHNEIELWSSFAPEAWENSIKADDSFFFSLYEDTVWYIRRILETHKLSGFLEIGCGTGQIVERTAFGDGRINERNDNRKFVGIDINEHFIEHCKNNTRSGVEYFVADATRLVEWQNNEYPTLYDERLCIGCVNNTLSIMPPEIRPAVVRQMRKLAGGEGIVFLSYWNGMKFREGLVNYYKKNPQLCGTFDIAIQDFQRRKLLTDTGYTSYWPLENEVELMVISYGVRPADIIDIKVVGKGVFVIVKGLARTSEDLERSQMEQTVKRVQMVLGGFGLERYASVLVQNGFDDVEMWSEVTHEMLKEIGMKAGHRLKWDKMCRTLQMKRSPE